MQKNYGTVGYMKELRRLQVGEFKLNNSIDGNKIIKAKNSKQEEEVLRKEIENKIITIEELFKSKSKIVLDEKKLNLYLNGVQLSVNEKDDIYNIYERNGKYIGLGIVKDSKLKRDICI